MSKNEYRIEYTYSSREDIHKMKKYIWDNFQYREYADNFVKGMKVAAKGLKIMPAAFDAIGFRYRGYGIHMKPYRTYLIFYVVDNVTMTVTVLRILKDGMDWQYIIKQWLKQNEL